MEEKKEVDPLQLLNDRFEEIIFSLELCKDKGFVLPSLMILYNAIDSAAHLYSSNKSGKKRFIDWVDKFMIKSEDYGFTAIDLYSARCGILHTLTSTSSLVLEGKARKGIYSLDDSKEEDLQELLDPSVLNECFFVKLDDLIKLFYKGFLEFFDSIFIDTKLKSDVVSKCGKYYSHTTIDKLAKEAGIKTV
ncbi:MAG: hypothetical protein HND52_14035 [Ignavibacteriae bacterium]|nr:hypothetical protein [Ignavibacteriota bacterium]NOG99074.1 hypothetical protein [Ignavibacteriota bacterium]